MKMLSSRLGLAALLVAAPAFAQSRPTPVSKSSWIIAGSASFNQTHDDLSDQTQTSVVASPTALVFVASRFAIGGSLTAGYSKAGSSRFTNYGIGPTARYYFGDSTEKWLPYLSASVFPQWATSKSSVFANGVLTSFEGDQTNLAMDAAFGLTRILVEHVGATGEAYYTRANRSTTSSGTTSDYTTNGFGARFGLSVFLY